MKTFDISRLPSMITLGYDGENNWRPNRFDCSSLLANHPNGVITLWLLPQGESQAFPVAVQRDGNVIVWTPLNEEMTAEYGSLQIQCDDGTDVGKSDTAQYHVKGSLVSGAAHPATMPSWAARVVEATGHYPKIENGNWYVWDVQNAEWADTGVSASGGEISPEDIAQAVADYLDEHPITAEEIEYICRSADDDSRSASPTYAEVVGKWDRLRESYPNNITKETIGQDSGGNNIWAYTVRSHTDTALDWCKPMTANRKILWLSGIHGHEITVPYDDFVFFSDLVRHHGENPTLQWLWDHVTFVVVPVICPWGLDHGSRVNANGVNLNRNFPASNWAVSGAGTNDYSGAAAGSEPETQALMALVNAHKDALFAVNRHTMNAFSPTARYAYISSLIQTDRQAASEAFKALDGICKTNFDVFADLDLARNLFAVCDSTVTGTLDQWYNEQGVHGFLLEMSPYFNASHFPNADAILAQNINATVIGNFLFGFTQEPKAFSDELPTLVWEAGVVSSRGDNLSNNYRIRTKDAVQLPAGTVVTIDNGYRYKVNTYSRWTSPTDFAMVENGSFMTDSFRVTGGSLYYRFSVASVSDDERVADDVPGTAAHLHMEIIESELAAVAYSGSYNDLQDTPVIPSLTGYATETWVQNQGYQTAAQVQTAINAALNAIPSAESEAY